MGAVPCSICVAEGVDCPLAIDGECLHHNRHETAEDDRPSDPIRLWVDTGPLDPLMPFSRPVERNGGS